MKKLFLILLSSVLPLIPILAPTNLYAQQTVGGTITLVANATDAGCGVASVQFFINNNPLSPPLTTPTNGTNYTIPFNTANTGNGPYTLTAVAKDKAGINTSPATACDSSKQNSTTSNAINIVIDNKPTDNTGPVVTITITVTVTP